MEKRVQQLSTRPHGVAHTLQILSSWCTGQTIGWMNSGTNRWYLSQYKTTYDTSSPVLLILLRRVGIENQRLATGKAIRQLLSLKIHSS